ncbi:MAG TPA: methylmalonyl Co-A mutase-associated GTPase MeaB [Candidatus Marinimicrobia bacterium]|jgi:LAO/AO transport system kinase|nr:methylmalonyl Co-A mutase-associated GTPase MeaB [Candidatus Neomarinimicrobiota bacterium]MDP7217579.1 methylmalonyl Co-A mutase-associated GTPase MeaB [Candidatus Neomarinimicrobiota bacterium]MDP7436350.1 methylmalonyl Co-A mutase-associated GTPase MeaB [Candidatus Neomarinimicrobiota bacterium]HBN44861.1 methylmalonyl Co-A mutase-associated GTPase MeaB [Candidatus Neomarinimicrobiota bacterium]HJL75145.1 methylmalonyl Co-A mutase-associated GTPase MeaB [Candidatus Neomarinimicrobiota bac|tara:strand:- start:15986 stop:16921 length:936 start_codon:yes stop_codon:yes gene_type:complete
MEKHLFEGITANDHRALSRIISRIEFEDSIEDDFFIELHEHSTGAIRLGITGPPGAGKSTLTDQLINQFVDKSKSVGVIAVDPTSPFSGGALLGDRVRMNRYIWENNVFIRSMGSHGDLGGLARKAQDVGDVLAASGKDVIIFETVGVGQGEHDVAKAVDLTIVVLVPESGDEIQLMKAGLIEIADLFIINKADRDGANRLANLLQNMLHSANRDDKLEPPVFTTIANNGTGISELFAGIHDHMEKMRSNGFIDEKRLDRHRSRVLGLVQEKLLDDFWTSEKLAALEKQTDSIDSIKASPHEISAALLNHE